MNLSATCTQQEFADLVGISQPAVSDLLTRGVINAGQPVSRWLLAYAGHLREQAAGRGGDGELAANRAAESRVRKELLEIKLAERRQEVAPVAVIEMVLAHIGSQIRSQMEGLPGALKMRCPQLTSEDVQYIQREVSALCNLAASASLDSLSAMDGDEEETAGA